MAVSHPDKALPHRGREMESGAVWAATNLDYFLGPAVLTRPGCETEMVAACPCHPARCHTDQRMCACLRYNAKAPQCGALAFCSETHRGAP